jgi:rhamnosyltransferase
LFRKEDVLSVIITYNCNNLIHKNVNYLYNQVGHILIIDNNSNKLSKEIIKELLERKNVTIIFNKQNYGLSYALNQGLNFASQHNYKLILTMDQDTILLDDAVNEMIKALSINNKLVSVGPIYNNKINQRKGNENLYQEVNYLITSGNLTYVESALKAGGFNEKLFIDSVDFDFSLSLRGKGGKLAKVNNAYMKHAIGESEKIKFLIFTIKIQSHSPLRHYYMYRNHYYIIKKYLLKYPLFCIKKEIFSLVYFLKLLLFHSNKKEKINMIFKGVKDAVLNRYGKYSKV